MLSSSILKNTGFIENNIPGYIEALRSNVSEEDWETVANKLEKLDNAWEKTIKRIQFSTERSEINKK